MNIRKDALETVMHICLIVNSEWNEKDVDTFLKKIEV